MFVRAKNYELNGNAAILVISPLKSIIEDQLQEMELLLGYPAKDLANLSNDDIRQCNFKIAFATAEKVKEQPFRAMLVDSKSKLHWNISAILVDESLNSVDSAILTASKLCALISGCLNAILAAVFQLCRARFEIKDLVETSKVLRTTSPLGFNIRPTNTLWHALTFNQWESHW